MNTLLLITQSIISILFIISVLLQEKSSAMSLTFGGGDNNQTFYGSKQGFDKFLSRSSYVLGGLFMINALLFVVLK
ncbi:MAG TPA: preprotein translocase subunit SecG [Candidatus Gracilibacteria bacterium]|nr:preprotein translocase subunit SecG [Candidatus Gracilibacteria bacterium]